jgi:hypothetical protein
VPLSPPALDLAGFTALTIMPSSDVATLESLEPGFLVARIAYWQGYIEVRLTKRYVVPFAAPVPPVVQGWLSDIVTVDAYNKRGRNAADPAIEDLKAERTRALAEIKEAADSKEGLFDLPLRADLPTSAITRGGPLGYAEQSPYTAMTLQGIDGRAEDESNGR